MRPIEVRWYEMLVRHRSAGVGTRESIRSWYGYTTRYGMKPSCLMRSHMTQARSQAAQPGVNRILPRIGGSLCRGQRSSQGRSTGLTIVTGRGLTEVLKVVVFAGAGGGSAHATVQLVPQALQACSRRGSCPSAAVSLRVIAAPHPLQVPCTRLVTAAHRKVRDEALVHRLAALVAQLAAKDPAAWDAHLPGMLVLRVSVMPYPEFGNRGLVHYAPPLRSRVARTWIVTGPSLLRQRFWPTAF